MLNAKRIKIMTRLESFEQNGGKKALGISAYFRKDYISMRVILTLITTSIAYALLCVLYAASEYGYLLNNFQDINLFSIFYKVIGAWIIIEVSFAFIAYHVYKKKYIEAKEKTAIYIENLKQLDEIYKQEKAEKAGYTAPVGGVLKYEDFTGV